MTRSCLFLILSLRLVIIDTLTLANADAPCSDEMRVAEDHYGRGQFDEVVVLLNRCLDTGGLMTLDEIRARRLLALTYISKDYRDEARSEVARILALDPNFRADPASDPPPFVNMVDEARGESSGPTSRSRKMWLWGAVAAVSGAVAVLLSGGSGGDANGTRLGPIEGPPALPE
jgi:hypothetical protein